ncbi:hypothetical protein CRE_21891 [Caenorhabditis remanei]|uniref:Uncharacterized protein n=1 Tax=Caenorhabditis remanei TaxID=31234 RepID=E3MUH4_CAERE|nr:hypothetical protein CRE_21891 [Caenorhabditis remanei]
MVESSDDYNSSVENIKRVLADFFKQELRGLVNSILAENREMEEAVSDERRNIKRRIRSQKEKWESVQRKLQENRKRKMKREKKARRICKKKMKAAKSRQWLKFRELKYNFVSRKEVILRLSICSVPLVIYRCMKDGQGYKDNGHEDIELI